MTIRELMRHIKLVNKRTSRTTKIAVCTAVALSVAALLVLHSAALDAQAKADAWRERAQQLEQENDRLRSRLRTYEEVISRNNLWHFFSGSRSKNRNRDDAR